MTWTIRTRQDLEAIEKKTLAPFAAFSADFASSRLQPEPQHPYRTAFQRDRDRIVHSRAFRRLKHKRQVFLTQFGDHYRTRLTHTLEVAQLSRTMARGMGVNEDLAEAIALGHDLGHTPFGHIGEVVLHDILSGRDSLDGLLKIGDAGGFKHNYQSVRIVDVIEKKYSWEGLNLTSCVREGILKHTRLRRQELHFPDFHLEGLHYEMDNAATLEGQIVAVADEIAQRTHDLEDGIRAEYVTIAQVCEVPLIRKVMGRPSAGIRDDYVFRNAMIRGLINLLVTDVMESSLRRLETASQQTESGTPLRELIVWFSDAMHPLQQDLDGFIAERIIKIASEQRSDIRAIEVIRELVKYYYLSPERLPGYRLVYALDARTRRDLAAADLSPADGEVLRRRIQGNPLFLRAICDHIAGMTDNYAEAEVVRLRGETHAS